MQKIIPFRDRIKSIKFIVFILVWLPSVVFMPMHLLNGTQFVSLMTLIVGIFTVAHEHSKSMENGNGGGGNEKPPQ